MRERTDAGRGRTAAFILLFLVLGALLTEEIEDLVPAAVPEDLVAVDDLVVAPALDLVMEELLVPALLETEPMPLLVVEPVVATLGL